MHDFTSIVQFSNQAVLIAAALFSFFCGGYILCRTLYWRMRSIRVSGTVIGVIADNGLYTTVYKYSLPSGETHIAKSIASTKLITERQTGRPVSLRVFKLTRTMAIENPSLIIDIIGSQFTFAGIFFTYDIFTSYPLNLMTWLFAAVVIAFLSSYIFTRTHMYLKLRKEKHDINGIEQELLKNAKPVETFLPSSEALTQDSAKTHSGAIKEILTMLAVALPFGLLGTFFSGRYLIIDAMHHVSKTELSHDGFLFIVCLCLLLISIYKIYVVIILYRAKKLK